MPQAPVAGTAGPSASDAVADTRLADLDALEAALRAHPSPPDITSAVAALRERAARMDDDAFLVELMRLTAGRAGDGHTGVFPLAQPDLELWPLRLYRFAEGWRIIAAAAPHGDLVGRQVTGIGGRPVEVVADMVGPTVSADTPASVLGRLPQHLVTTDVLRGLGIDPVLELDGQRVDVAPVSTAEYAEWASLPYPLICPPLGEAEDPVWVVEERDGGVIVRYRRVLPHLGDQRPVDLADELQAAVDRIDADAVVLDVRDNPGGDTGTARPLVDRLIALEAARPGRLRILVNRCTFSAATNVVVQLLEATDAVVVGEAMGGAPTMWGDAVARRLPSGIVVHVASRTWALGGADAPAVLEPDVPVPVRWADHVAGVDPAPDAALAADVTVGRGERRR